MPTLGVAVGSYLLMEKRTCKACNNTDRQTDRPAIQWICVGSMPDAYFTEQFVSVCSYRSVFSSLELEATPSKNTHYSLVVQILSSSDNIQVIDTRTKIPQSSKRRCL